MKPVIKSLTETMSLAYGSAFVAAAFSLPMASANAQQMLEEVVVTAQKRPERLVDVPVSITTVSSGTLAVAGTDSLKSLNKLVPGVYINQPVYYLSPTVRGVGSTLSVSTESNVAIYVDGVYQPVQSSNLFDLATIESIEVLKGPQGTLFGRNATGGAFLVKTLDPSFQNEGNLAVSYGRFDELKANGYINAPVSDTVAANLALSYGNSDGYIRDIRTGRLVNESDTFAARGKILFQPISDLEVILTASYAESDDPTASSFQSFEGENVLASVPGAGPIATDRYDLSHDIQDILKNEAEELNLRVNYDVSDFGTLSSITAYKEDLLTTTNDVDSSYLDVFRVDFELKNETFSQEVNYTSTGNNHSFVAGAYYFRNEKYYPLFQYGRVDFLKQENTTDSVAVYSDGTYDFGDITLIAGLRYTMEKRTLDNALLPHPLNAVVGSRSIDAKDEAWTPRIGLKYALSDRSNVYATYSRGFKSGVFNGTSLTSPGVEPEEIDAYEIGYKGIGDQHSFNAAMFYYDYKDIQASTIVIKNGAALASVVNAAEGEIYGVELDGSYMFSESFDVRVAIGYTNAEYSSFPDAPGYERATGGGFNTVPIDATGNTMVRTPELQASAQINYTVSLAGHGLRFSLSPSYQSEVYYDFANSLNQDGVFLLDGSINLELQNGLKISVFGQNITDEEYLTTLNYSTLNIAALYAKPVTYGVELSYDFW